MLAMPLLRKLSQGERVTVAGLIDDEGGYQYAVDFEDPCGVAVRFDVQVAADLYWRGVKDEYRMEDLGPLKMPYDDMWMEWSVPPGSLIEASEDLMHELIGMRCGAYLRAHEDGGIVSVFMAINPDTGETFLWPTVELVATDDKGNFIGIEAISRFEGLDNKKARESAAMVSMFILPAYMALGLINCKNVQHRETGAVKMRRSGTEKRRGIPPKELRYNTIVLPGGGTVAGSKRGSSHRAAAVHRVRGHFKTFTEEKPLMGRHVGTYWWGWQVRGNPEHGEVQSDYTLGEK